MFTEGEGIFREMHSTLTGWGSVRAMPDGSGTLAEVCVRQFPVVMNATPSVTNEFHHFLHITLDEDKESVMTTIQHRPNAQLPETSIRDQSVQPSRYVNCWDRLIQCFFSLLL
ncbi:hypothetical protein F442_22585 [Phytophthora nicotianae P10297]|uniref:Uncharacterized protein n=1 Tax=Phytophthora nicotianae P10297 TaxID=1317064 RepID=W2Y0F7_PHYNI|nr:hypothetical protein F442_22585 [Phytophthora nicotianae P10297]